MGDEYGADKKGVRLRAIGPDGSDEGFAVRFPNGLVLDIVPQGTALQVSDRSGNYSKTFEWQYAGPVDGRGTFCTPCVEKADAIGFVRRNFIKECSDAATGCTGDHRRRGRPVRPGIA